MYRAKGYISENLTKKAIGFSEDDLELLREAIINISEIIDGTKDGLRFCYLGNEGKANAEQAGISRGMDVQNPLIL